MKQTVVAYYSRTGGTRKVAGQLAAILDADLEEIREAKDRSGRARIAERRMGLHAQTRSGPRQRAQRRGAQDHRHRDAHLGIQAAARRAELPKKVNLAGKKVCAVSTCFALGGDRVLDAVAAMVPGGLAARLALKRPAAQPNLAATLKEWAKQVGG